MSEFSVERLATELSVERYFAPQPRQGVVGALYVVVLVTGVLLAVALTVLFVRLAMHVPASLPDRVGRVPGGDRANADTHASPAMPTAGSTAQGGAGAPAATGAAMDGGIGEGGAGTGSGIGESRLKDFYLKCALNIGRRHRMDADGAVACGQLADVMLAQRSGSDVEPTLPASGAQVVQRLATQQG